MRFARRIIGLGLLGLLGCDGQGHRLGGRNSDSLGSSGSPGAAGATGSGGGAASGSGADGAMSQLTQPGGRPKVAVNERNDGILVWEGRDASSWPKQPLGPGLFAARWTSDGLEAKSWTTPEFGIFADVKLGAVHLTGSGVAFVAYATTTTTANRFHIMVTHAEKGIAFISAQDLNTVGLGDSQDTLPPRPALALREGNGVVAWVDPTTHDSGVVHASSQSCWECVPPDFPPAFSADEIIDIDETGHSGDPVLSADLAANVIAIWDHNIAPEHRQIVTNRHFEWRTMERRDRARGRRVHHELRSWARG